MSERKTANRLLQKLLSLCLEYNRSVSCLSDVIDTSSAAGTLRLLIGSEADEDKIERSDALSHYHRDQARSWCFNAYTESLVVHPRTSSGTILSRCDTTLPRIVPLQRALTRAAGRRPKFVGKLSSREHRFIGTLAKIFAALLKSFTSYITIFGGVYTYPRCSLKGRLGR